MIVGAEDELQQYLVSINPVYAKYAHGLWVREVNSSSQLGDASFPILQACGVLNELHAVNIIAQSKAGKWFSVLNTLTSQVLCKPYAHSLGPLFTLP